MTTKQLAISCLFAHSLQDAARVPALYATTRQIAIRRARDGRRAAARGSTLERPKPNIRRPSSAEAPAVPPPGAALILTAAGPVNHVDASPADPPARSQ